MVADTLTIIENWYKESNSDQERPKLLSKLAFMEFCGWLEEWMDELVCEVDKKLLQDADWIKKNVVDLNHGFHYEKHLRAMLCRVLGEHKIRPIERQFEVEHPGDLDAINSDLGRLWSKRCKLAHADLAAHKAKQVNIDAPSWTKNQYRVLSRRLEAFRICLVLNI